uniref:Uncharacterized protein n=1 Tax=Meloidogyne hapla TaxID=6305 RepID=A0A1I8BP42_MELHA
MIYKLLINDKINDENIGGGIDKYISSKENKGKELELLERVMKACNLEDNEKIPDLNLIYELLDGDITFFSL